jgi:hypothetical protein
MRENAQLNKVSGITKEMVSKNYIKDYVESHLTTEELKNVLDKSLVGLKEIFPDLTKEQLRDAYLKEGDYKLDTKKKVQSELAKGKTELKNIARLENDIADLKAMREVKTKVVEPNKKLSDYENELVKERQEIIDKQKADRKQIADDNKKLETERIRQLTKVDELKQKIKDTEDGIKKSPKGKDEKVDTPEIEALKTKLADAQKKLRQEESEQKRSSVTYKTKKISWLTTTNVSRDWKKEESC